MKVCFNLAQWFLRRCLKSVDDGRKQRTKPAYTISSPMSHCKGSSELTRTENTIMRFHQEMKIVSFNVNKKPIHLMAAISSSPLSRFLHTQIHSFL